MKKPIYLFQGDSITDCNRNRQSQADLGDGYVSILQELNQELNIINRGISGDRVNELLERWKEDALDLHPEVISIYIGINDVWHHHEWGKPYSISSFITMYQQLIDQIKKQNPKTTILLISPFVLKTGHYKAIWQKDIDDIIQAVEHLAKLNKTLYLSLSEAFDVASQTYSTDELTWDGVHPKPLGHKWIASQIEKVLNL